MTDATAGTPGPGLSDRFAAWRNRLASSRAFQRWAARFPLTRRVARKDGERLFDLMAGFAYTQTLLAVVELDLLETLHARPASLAEIARKAGMEPRRAETLCQAATSLGLFERAGVGRYRLGRLGAAVLGVPGLDEMIRHHRLFYDDLADPVALLRGETAPALAAFWSYVNAGDVDPDQARSYSRLMQGSQALVAEETLDAVDLRRSTHLMDIGGGTGAFLDAALAAFPHLKATLFDLPAVVAARPSRPDDGIRCIGGSFLTDPLPRGADTVSLVRVLYDHDDDTVARILAAAFAALPDGGRVVVSEPMSGGVRPTRSGDAYFGLYTLAMTTGTPRSVARHGELLQAAGFTDFRQHRTRRPFITSVISARRAG